MHDQARIADRLLIADVLAEYCRTLDLMDLGALARLFTRDCVVDYGPEARMKSEGRATLERDLARLWRWARTSHHLSNVQVRFDGDDLATSTCYVIAWHERPDGGTATLFGQYHDVLLRSADGWLISRRKQFMNGNDAGFDVNIHRFPRRERPD